MEGVLEATSLVARVVAATIAVLLMGALTTMGLVEIARGVLIFLGLASPHGELPVEATVLSMALKGLEFLFLAPLSYLALISLFRYVDATAAPLPQRRNPGARGVHDVTAEQFGEAAHNAHVQLARIKGLIIALMIATVATDLVARVLHPAGVSYRVAVTEGAVIIVLGLYLACLEYIAGRPGPHA